jgi:hypothetical protein
MAGNAMYFTPASVATAAELLYTVTVRCYTMLYPDKATIKLLPTKNYTVQTCIEETNMASLRNHAIVDSKK